MLAMSPVVDAQAQDLWAFQGRVTSTNGAPQQGVTVRNGGQITQTDADGRYRLGQLLPGSYTLRASKPCFKPEHAEIVVLVPADTEVDFSLTPIC